MSTPRKYKPIGKAFETITVDGMELAGLDAFLHFKKLDRRRKEGEEWKNELFILVVQLAMMAGKAIQVRTSGTTGPPKQMGISRRDLVMSARLTAETFGLQRGDRVLLCLPCDHIAGKMMIVRAMVLGLDLHVVDPRGSVLDNLKVHDRFRFAAMVPLQLHRAIQEDRARVEQQFDTILLGGGPVSAALEEDLQGLRTKVFHSYGSTETVTHVALRKLNGPDRDKLFHALGQVGFATDQRGCLVVETPHLTRKMHITNDLVKLKDNKRFQWLGRIDNVILSGGKKIYPEQLEAKTAGVIAYPHFFMAFNDDRLGQAVMLVLETERGPMEVIDELMPALLEVLAPHERPRRITALHSFRRTPSGKVIREL